MIALYCRVSTVMQVEEGFSLGEQEERLRNYCKALGLKNLKVFRDGGFSGSNIDRPALQSLIRAVEKHQVEKVIVYKLDRLSRSQKDTLMLIEDTFLKNGCDFVSISENFDTSTPFGRAMIGILSVFAQLEREQIKERMMMGKEARAKLGKYSTSTVLVGYDYENGELVPNEYEKMLIVRVFTEYANGKRVFSIRRDLNAEGLFHKYGKWSDSTVNRVLNNKTYIGYIKHSSKWYKGTHEPLVSEELFDKCQKMLERVHEENKLLNRRLGKSNSYLAGVLYCGRCGAKYSRRSAFAYYKGEKLNYTYYICNSRSKANKDLVKDCNCKNKSWKMSELDEIVIGEIRKLSFEEFKPIKTEIDNSVIEKKIAEIERKIERYMELYALGNVPIDVIKQKVDELNQQREDLIQIPTEKMSPSEACEIVATLDDVLNDGNVEEINSLVRSLIDKVVVDGRDISIYWAFE